jgi:hypothetical protein
MKSPCCNFLIAIDHDGVKRCAKYGCLKVIQEAYSPPSFIEPKEVKQPEVYVIGEDDAKQTGNDGDIVYSD